MSDRTGIEWTDATWPAELEIRRVRAMIAAAVLGVAAQVTGCVVAIARSSPPRVVVVPVPLATPLATPAVRCEAP